MRKVAFLVANDTFPEDPSIPPLLFTQNDAKGLKEVLEDAETCGFEPKIYVNKTRREVLTGLESVSGELDTNDIIMFYYAGHGKVHKDNELYLYSANTVATLASTSIPAHDVLKYLQQSYARRRVLILDCCQSGAIGRTFRGSDEEREKDGHGLFTKALIDCLREPKKESITVADLFAFASEQLRISGSQKPKQWALDVEG